MTDTAETKKAMIGHRTEIPSPFVGRARAWGAGARSWADSMAGLDRWNHPLNRPRNGDPVRWNPAWQKRALTRSLILKAAQLAWLPNCSRLGRYTVGDDGRLLLRPLLRNESNRTAVVTVQVFNGWSGFRETVEINLFAPGANETVTEVRECETRAVTFRVPRGGAVQVRGPGGNGEFKSSFSVVAR